MTRLPNPDQVERYERDGFLFPIDVLTPVKVTRYRAELQACEQAQGGPIDFPEKSKSYLLLDWADQLVQHPRILDVVQDVIGLDTLDYHSTLLLKEVQTPAVVRWHHDSTYFYLGTPFHVTAWVALSDTTDQAGCVRVPPGSHHWGSFARDDKPEPMNMNQRRQRISGRFDHKSGGTLPVIANQLSIHQTDPVHTSGSNDSDDRRLGFAIGYLPAYLKPTGPVRSSALCIRGKGRRHFLAEQRLKHALSTQAHAQYKEALPLFRSLPDAGFSSSSNQVSV